MLRSITCIHCRTRQTTRVHTAAAKKVRCRACGSQLPPAALEDLLRMQGLMRRGDDEGGGGDWGGGGSSDDESGEAEGEDEEEDDGKGGKKKKKKKSGGFFANMLGGFITRLIGMAIAAVLLLTCCCGVVVFGLIFGFGPPFVGEWEGSFTKTIQVEQKDDKGEVVKNDKGEVVKKDEMVTVIVKLELKKTDDKSGTGVYTTTIEDENPVTFNFKWKDWDKEKKTVVFEMDKSSDTFWKGIKSPATFTYDTLSGLSLSAGAEKMTFTHPPKEPGAAPAPKKAGGGKKRR
jgi:hypothetical protein